MALHKDLVSEELAKKFTQARDNWNLEKLYRELASAKQQVKRNQNKPLTQTEKACLRGLLSGYSPTEIASQLNRETNGLRVDLSRGLYRYIEILTGSAIKSWSNVSKQLENAGYKLPKDSREVTSSVPKIQNHIDWGEAIDVSIFYGRTDELTTLQRWVTQDKCRLITLLGMGGIGKTALSVKLAQLVQEGFEFVIWRSLRDSPPPPLNY